MKYPKVKAPLVGGNEIAAEKVLSDLARNVGRIFGYEKNTQGTVADHRLVIHTPPVNKFWASKNSWAHPRTALTSPSESC